MSARSPYRLTLLVCLAEIFGLAAVYAFPALLPTFRAEWMLSNTQAGWISSAYYAGYMVLVPVLTSITDRVDARKIMGLGALLGALSAAGYAFLAQGFWSALGLRLVGGVSLAGIYMPGLKVVSDHTEGEGTLQSRRQPFVSAGRRDQCRSRLALGLCRLGRQYTGCTGHRYRLRSAGAGARRPKTGAADRF
ncbi:MAG: MFS transporter [Desulfobacterales bacterium]